MSGKSFEEVGGQKRMFWKKGPASVRPQGSWLAYSRSRMDDRWTELGLVHNTKWPGNLNF